MAAALNNPRLFMSPYMPESKAEQVGDGLHNSQHDSEELGEGVEALTVQLRGLAESAC